MESVLRRDQPICKLNVVSQDRFYLKGLINQVVNSECGTSAQTTGGLSRECSHKTGSTVFELILQ